MLERFQAFNNTYIKIPRDFLCVKYLHAFAKTILHSPQWNKENWEVESFYLCIRKKHYCDCRNNFLILLNYTNKFYI